MYNDDLSQRLLYSNIPLLILAIIVTTAIPFACATCSPFLLSYKHEVCNPKINQHCAPFLDCVEGRCMPWYYLVGSTPSDPSLCASNGLTIGNNGKCLPARFIGDACEDNNQCLFGVCAHGKCVERREGESCTNYLSNECGINLYCDRNRLCRRRHTPNKSCIPPDEITLRLGSCERSLTCVTADITATNGICKAKVGNRQECNRYGYIAPDCKAPYYCPDNLFDSLHVSNCESNLDSLKEGEHCIYDPLFRVQDTKVCAFDLSCNTTLSICERIQTCSDKSNNCFSGATHQYLTTYCNCTANSEEDGLCAILENCRFTNADFARVRTCVVDKCYGGSDAGFPFATQNLIPAMFDRDSCPFKRCSHEIQPYICCMINYHKSSPKFTLPPIADTHFFMGRFCEPPAKVEPMGPKWLVIASITVAITSITVIASLIFMLRKEYKTSSSYETQEDVDTTGANNNE
jgi:hypothetical protein